MAANMTGDSASGSQNTSGTPTSEQSASSTPEEGAAPAAAGSGSGGQSARSLIE